MGLVSVGRSTSGIPEAHRHTPSRSPHTLPVRTRSCRMSHYSSGHIQERSASMWALPAVHTDTSCSHQWSRIPFRNPAGTGTVAAEDRSGSALESVAASRPNREAHSMVDTAACRRTCHSSSYTFFQPGSCRALTGCTRWRSESAWESVSELACCGSSRWVRSHPFQISRSL